MAASELDVEKLAKEFAKPLANVEKCDVASEEAAKDELERLHFALVSKSKSQTLCDAMRHAMELLKGGIHYYENGKMESLTPRLVACLSHSNTAVMKQAALLVAALAQALEEEYSRPAETLYPVLMELFLSDDVETRNCAHLALLAIVKWCQDARIGKLFIANYTSSLPNHRYIAIEAAHIILETWNPDVTDLFRSDVETCVSCLEIDTSKFVRILARLTANVKRRVKGTKRPRSTLVYHPAPRKSIKSKPMPVLHYVSEKTEVQNTSTQENVDQSISSDMPIDRVMPPSNDEEAKVFKTLLDKLVASCDVDALMPVVNQLVPSIYRTSQVIHGRSAWETDLDFLYEHFAREMKMYVMKIMATFDFDEWIIRIMEKNYPLQIWSEALNVGSEARQLLAVTYFSSIFQMEPVPLKVTAKIRSLLELLVKNCREKTETSRLEAVLTRCRLCDEIARDVERMLDILYRQGDWSRELDDIVARFNGQEDIAERIEEIVNDRLPVMLSDGTEQQQGLIIQFIIVAAPKLKNVSFYKCIDTIVAIVVNGECPFKKKAIIAISKTLDEVKALAASIQMVEQSTGCEGIIFSAMLRHFDSTSRQKMIPTRKIIIRKLAPFLLSEDSHVRKTVAKIFTVFQRKIPSQVASVFQELTPAQRRIIELLANPI